jgi:hypothetical protein
MVESGLLRSYCSQNGFSIAQGQQRVDKVDVIGGHALRYHHRRHLQVMIVDRTERFVVNDDEDYTRRMQNVKSSLPGKTSIIGESPQEFYLARDKRVFNRPPRK